MRLEPFPTGPSSMLCYLLALGGEFLEIIKDCYNSVTTFETSWGSSEPTVMSACVRKGDPLSGLLFIITIDFILNRLQKFGEEAETQCDLTHLVLAYADDMLLLAKDEGTLQALLDLAHSLSQKFGLNFNPDKCATLYYSCAHPAGVWDIEFKVNGRVIPHLSDGDAHIFLGKPVGSFLPKDTESLEGFRSFAQKIPILN